MSKTADGRKEARRQDGDSTEINSGSVHKFKSWIGERHGHIYGVIGIFGVVLAIVALLIQLDSGRNVHLKVDAYTREQIKKQVRDYRESQTVPRKTPSEGRVTVTPPDKMPDATNSGFQVVKHEVVVDFNNFEEVNSIDLPTLKSAVIQQVTHQIEKVVEASTFSASAVTSGLDVFVDSRTPMTVYASDTQGSVGGYAVKTRIIQFDVSKFAVGEEFTIQHQKTYWNAFQGDDQSWAGYEVRVPTQEIEYLIIFPEDKPFREIKFLAHGTDGRPRRLDGEAYVLKAEDKTWLWWRAVNPPIGTSYHIDWEWLEP